MAKANDRKQVTAFQMFMTGSYDQGEIADILGVTGKTISDWKQKFKWEERKLEELTSTKRIVEHARKALLDEFENPERNADNVSKYAKIIRDFESKNITALENAQMLMSFMTYLQTVKQNALAKTVADIAPSYIDFLLEHEK